MKFLLTNDDGYDAPGLSALICLSETLGATVVAAPDTSRSGIGHQVTAYDPIRVDEEAENRYRVYGTPADCSRLGLTHFAPDADWVIAGFNNGGNLGADVYISGTVAAAREAALLGYRAMAFSHYVGRDRSVDWVLAKHRMMPILEMLLSRDLLPNHFWNINFPAPIHKLPTLEHTFCDVDSGPLSVDFDHIGTHYVFKGNYHERPRQQGRDVDVCFGGKVAISMIPLDITQRQ